MGWQGHHATVPPFPCRSVPFINPIFLWLQQLPCHPSKLSPSTPAPLGALGALSEPAKRAGKVHAWRASGKGAGFPSNLRASFCRSFWSCPLLVVHDLIAFDGSFLQCSCASFPPTACSTLGRESLTGSGTAWIGIPRAGCRPKSSRWWEGRVPDPVPLAIKEGEGSGPSPHYLVRAQDTPPFHQVQRFLRGSRKIASRHGVHPNTTQTTIFIPSVCADASRNFFWDPNQGAKAKG